MRPAAKKVRAASRRYFNPRTPCGVRRDEFGKLRHRLIISIHAPLAGCDLSISSHFPLDSLFQSTHPLRGATDCFITSYKLRSHFNPRTPCGVRPSDCSMKSHAKYFNPRTPCGVRHCLPPLSQYPAIFQSTHPLRGATEKYQEGYSYHEKFQSTHPLRGATRWILRCRIHYKYFNPRTPCGVRPRHDRRAICGMRFQSTHPLRGATPLPCQLFYQKQFQSTHPLRGATESTVTVIVALKFQSTHPLRGATAPRGRCNADILISIHAPLAGCDDDTYSKDVDEPLFQSTHPLRGATCV